MRQFRDVLGAFVTGVTVVTARNGIDGGLIGITANSFNSVSLDPPLILVSLSKSLRSLPSLVGAPAFAVNLLCESHRHLSQKFSRAGDDKWSGVETEPGVEGAPILRERLAHFECKPWARYEGGDHVILVGEVVDYALVGGEEPLVFFRGSYRKLLIEQRAG